MPCLVLPLSWPLLADEDPSGFTWTRVIDGRANRIEVGLSGVTIHQQREDMPEVQGRHLGVRSTYPRAVSGMLVVLRRRPGSSVEWPSAFLLYLPASRSGAYSIANRLVALDTTPIHSLGPPPPAPRELPVRAYLLDMKEGADAEPVEGASLRPYDPVLDALDPEARRATETEWEIVDMPVKEGMEDLHRAGVSMLLKAYVHEREDPVARATAIALVRHLGELGMPGTAYHLACLLEPAATGLQAGAGGTLHRVPPADPDEAARLMDHAARVDGEPLAWFRLFQASEDEAERFVWALLLRTWEQYCPGDHFEGVGKVLDAGNERWTPEQGRELVLRAIRVGAEAGMPEAQVKLAMLYLEGVGGVPEDHEAALQLAYKAAQDGHVEACVLVGNLIQELRGMSDLKLAAKWFEQAARFGNAQGAYNLAVMHFRAMLGLPDDEQAAFYLGVAARLGHPQAVEAIEQMLGKLPEDRRPVVRRRIDEEMGAIRKRLEDRAASIQKRRRTGEDRENDWR